MALTSEKKTTAKSSKILKKTKVSKEKKTKGLKSSPPSHPPYFEMIKEAILALRERNGSSPYAIAKYIKEKHKGELPANFRKILTIQLRNLAAKEKLLRVKASFKLSESAKQGEKKAAKKAELTAKELKPKVASKVKKSRSVSASTPVKSKASVNVKKSAAVKIVKKKLVEKKVKKSASVKPKQPKSIKSPAAKKAKKAVV